MQRPAPPFSGGDGGSASDGRGPRGDLKGYRGDIKAYIIDVATSFKENVQTVFGRGLPASRPDEPRTRLDFVSPSVRAVINGPAITSYEVNELKAELQLALKEADTFLKAYAKEKQLPNDIGNECKLLTGLIQSYSDDVTYALEVGVRCNKISSQNATELRVLVERMNQTMIEKILRRGKSLPKVLDLWATLSYHKGSITSRIRSYINLYYTIKDVLGCLNQGPGLFKHIGKDAKDLIHNDYMCSNLRVDPLPNVYQSIAAGWGMDNQNTVRRILLNLKGADTTIALAGNRNNVAPNANSDSYLLSKVTLDNILGAQTKGVLYVPIPYRNAKFEFQSLHQFAGFTVSSELNANPALKFSCLLGIKAINFGGMIDVDTRTSLSSYCFGLSSCVGASSFGVTLNNMGGLTAMYHKRLDDKGLSFSALASHCCSTSRTHIMVGGMQRIEADLAVKARLSSSGFAEVMAKKMFWGECFWRNWKCTVGISSQFDLRQLWKAPRLGVVLTIG